MAVLQKLAGVWELESNDNYEAILAELNVDHAERPRCIRKRPTAQIEVNGSSVNLKHTGPDFTVEQQITIGQDFELTDPHSMKIIPMTASVEDDKLVYRPKEKEAAVLDYVSYEIIEEKMVCTLIVKGANCKRIFRRL
ncbi:sodium/calcium exchanger regulatory protein 1-like [Ptychodera flava]|uniref:sodium/calcium exchanger regulatory protein 1-like n=1 Tax=Ptychodera flava TaxID=63121 RepID=UPI003969D636